MADFRARLGVDIGGTFTDVALETPGGWFTTKVLTTQRTPEDGVIAAIESVLAEARIAPGELGLLIHGTTLATNAMIERKGALTAFLTTDGFRDTLEIATESRFDVYDVNLDLPAPLVPRELRFELPERMSARGQPLVKLDEKSVERVIEKKLIPRQVESVAVGFLHAYANPAHERRVRDMVRRRMPGTTVSLSSEVSPEMREYERFSTTCANAYVQPAMTRYLGGLRQRVEKLGVRCPLYLMLSGGGLTTVDTAIRFPVRLVESGPAGGAIFACHLARRAGLERVLSFDMGGTTAKICLIDGYAPQTARNFEVARVYRFKRGSGIPLRIPVIEMVEIGAGGGSIAAFDALGRLTVGPESAGSEPGPACYGQGGSAPTVTDADVVLGRIDPARFSSGRVQLDAKAAGAALDRVVGKRLKAATEISAFGVCEVVDSNMANAARVHAVESGKSLAERTLIAFGGAAPLHAARVAEKLGIARVLVPAAAGVGSCVGFLRAPIAFEVVRSFYQKLAELNPGSVNKLLEELRAEAASAIAGATADGAQVTQRRIAYMRYTGQGTEIAVDLPAGTMSAAGLRAAFEGAYRAQYNRVVPDTAIEVISFGVTLSIPGAADDPPAPEPHAYTPTPDGRRQMFDAAARAMAEVAVYRREGLRPGARFAGPALITEAQTSTVVTAAFDAAIDAYGHIALSKRGEK